ncbi:hypothetical protein HMI54_006593 [Coelomomyces lativittatus]|nr:hypothetical protein HMI54_006593 [Coelomomyces lativittatus]KAJ1507949.1 hypothetical protein HMI56_007529 [Coelomomyces lativittatus]
MPSKIALVSVSDKSNLIPFCKSLHQLDIQIIASGGTSKQISEAGLPVIDVAQWTNAPEMLGGRVKTLHPVVHGGILARDIPSDLNDLHERNIQKIDFVICNLYPFQKKIAQANVTMEQAVEEIDIGGVTLLRAAAKNHSRVTVLCDPKDYTTVLNDIHCNQGQVSLVLRQRLALKAFQHTAEYDDAISSYFRHMYGGEMKERALRYGLNPHQAPALAYVSKMTLDSNTPNHLPFQVLNGAPGYINLLDALNAWPLVHELSQVTGLPAATSFKHVSPAGAAVGVPFETEVEAQVCHVHTKEALTPLATAYARARGADRMSSFGDFIALSHVCDKETAQLIALEVSDGIIAPGYAPEALEILKLKKKGAYCILQIDEKYQPPSVERREVFGVTLQQPRNNLQVHKDWFQPCVSKCTQVTPEALRDWMVATVTAKYTQSNTVVLAKNGMTIGVGAGQQSRVHCTRLAVSKAHQWWLRHNPKVIEMGFQPQVKRAEQSNAIDVYVTTPFTETSFESQLLDWKHSNLFVKLPDLFSQQLKLEWLNKLENVVLVSDAFFPFPDSLHAAHSAGVKYIAAPGGSLNDQLVVETANQYNMVLSFIPYRLFHH